jgi:hypothetical protein
MPSPITDSEVPQRKEIRRNDRVPKVMGFLAGGPENNLQSVKAFPR